MRFLRTNEKHSNRDEEGDSTKPIIKVPSHEHGYLTLKLRGEGTDAGLSSHSARAAQSLRIYFYISYIFSLFVVYFKVHNFLK